MPICHTLSELRIDKHQITVNISIKRIKNRSGTMIVKQYSKEKNKSKHIKKA